MNLSRKTELPWTKKSRAELEEYVKRGASEIDRRSKSATAETENQFIREVIEMRGLTKKGRISTATANLSQEELLYQARKIDRFMKIDFSSAEGIDQLNKISESARSTFNNNYNMNLDKLQYREMVELIGAFKQENEGLSSEQIRTYFKETADKVTADELADIFSRAMVKQKGVPAKDRMTWIYNEIERVYKEKLK